MDQEVASAGTSTQATTRDPGGALVGLRNGVDRFYYLVDGLGSVVAVTDASGAVTHSYTYDPYGVTTETTSSSVANPWRYTGQYEDVSTGLYKMGARYYELELGRWTQRDPSGLEANAYLYARGNPANLIDPSGLFSFEDLKNVALTGLAAGGAGAAVLFATGNPILAGAAAGCRSTSPSRSCRALSERLSTRP